MGCDSALLTRFPSRAKKTRNVPERARSSGPCILNSKRFRCWGALVLDGSCMTCWKLLHGNSS